MCSQTTDFAHGATTWRTGQNICIIFDLGLYPPFFGNMTTSTKPEVHNVSYCC